jgi:hypothetical protein
VVVVPAVARYWLAVQAVCGVHDIAMLGAEAKLPSAQAAQIGCVVASPGVIAE